MGFEFGHCVSFKASRDDVSGAAYITTELCTLRGVQEHVAQDKKKSACCRLVLTDFLAASHAPNQNVVAVCFNKTVEVTVSSCCCCMVEEKYW
jgi:hypothetical protein